MYVRILHVSADVCGDQKHQSPLDLQLQAVVSSLVRVLGTNSSVLQDQYMLPMIKPFLCFLLLHFYYIYWGGGGACHSTVWRSKDSLQDLVFTLCHVHPGD